MKDNNDIKIAIHKLEQGRFQNMCNRLLFEMGFDNINQLGSQDESDKTTPGTPDTFLVKDNLYILVEYTVQKTQLYQKIRDDIKKCINKFEECDIKNRKILYFYTSSNLKLENYRKLQNLCNSKKITLELYNIDIIANYLRFKYPLIAKEYLDIEVDTLQILSPVEYIEEYNNSKFTIKINNNLLFRDREKLKILDKIDTNDIVLISGKSGVGKTHLILDILIHVPKKIENYEILCIKNRNQQLFDDLKKYLKEGKKYIIFIDDINNINNLEQLLYFLDPINNLDLKIIATVRDYAKNKVIDKIRKNEEETKNLFKIDYVKIKTLKDEELVEIIKTQTEIKNDLIIKNILYVAQGNARIMMMATSVISGKTDKKYTINEIYNIYYENMIKELSKKNPSIMKSLAVISFINVIDIKNEYHKSLIMLFKLDEKQFWNDMIVLHNNEIIDMIDEGVSKISEQCISNYSMYLSIFKNKDIKLSELIILLFSNSKSRLIEDVNVLLNVFKSKQVTQIVRDEINSVWSKIELYRFDKIIFLEAFGGFLELETFSYCIDQMKKIHEDKVDFNYFDVNSSKNKQFTNNSILKLLGKFKYSNNINIVLDIIFEYINKDNSIIPDVYKLLAYSWGYGKEIYYNNFNIQNTIIDRLIKYNKNYDYNFTYLTLNLIKHYLKINGDYSQSTGKKTITITQYCLCECENLRNFRNMMFDYLINLSKIVEFRDCIIDILDSLYSSGYSIKENFETIMENDKAKLDKIINNIEPHDFKALIIIDRINSIYRKFDIKNKKIKNDNTTYQVYKNLINIVCDDDNYKYDNTIKNMKKFVKKLTVSDINNYLKEIYIIESEKLLKNDYDINEAISAFFISIFDRDDINRSELLEECISINALRNFPIEKLIDLCIKNIGYDRTKKILMTHDYTNKLYFLINCYSLIPPEKVDVNERNNLIEFVSQKVNLNSGYNINLSFLDKFRTVDNNIFSNVISILLKLYKDDLFTFSLWTSMLFNKYSNNTPEKLIDRFQGNYEILINLYLQLIQNRENLDYDGEYFKEFIKLNYMEFINKYILFLINDDHLLSNNHNLLKYIWEENESIVDYTISLISKLDGYKKIHVLELLFHNDKSTYKKEEQYLIKLINIYKNDEEKIKELFSIIANRTKEGRIKCICEFLKLNDDINIFKELQLETYSWYWSGSEVPIIEKRIQFFNELLNEVEKLGINYIKHCLYIKEIINSLQLEKKETIRNEFLDDWL